MRARVGNRSVVIAAALAGAAAAAACGGPGGAARGPAEGSRPGDARAQASPCPPAILEAIPGEEPRDPLRSQLLECAAAAARTIRSDGVRGMVLDRIAAGLSAAGGYRRAAELTCELAPDAGQRARILGEVAAALARGGRVEGAIRLAEALERAPREEPASPGPGYAGQLPPIDPFDMSGAWYAIAIEQARGGELSRALASADRIRGPSAAMAQIAIVDALLARGKAAEAQPILDRAAEGAAGSAMDRPEALEAAAIRYARMGQKDRAATLLRGAIRALEGRGKWARGSRAALAAALGRIGHHEEAIGVLAGEGEVEGRLAAALLEAGEVDPARAVAEAIGEATFRARAMAALAKKRGEMGDARGADAAWEAARDAAVSVVGPRFKVEALAALAVTMTSARRAPAAEAVLSEAAQLATSIQDGTERQLALREAAVAHATIGRCVRALDLAMSAGDSGFTIREVAASCTDAGDYDQIEARIEDIKYPDHRGQALGALALKYAEAGRMDRMAAALARIEGPEERAQALAAIGQAALPEGAPALQSCPGVHLPGP